MRPTFISRPLYVLIKTRQAQLNLSNHDLFLRLGYKNISAAGSKLQRLMDNQFTSKSSLFILQNLAQALDISDEHLDQTLQLCLGRLDQTNQMQAEIETATQRRLDEEARKKFRPYGILKGTYRRPSQITIFALTGGAERWLHVKLNTAEPPTTFAHQVTQYIKAHPEVQFFGPATGFAVRYTYDEIVHFDINGNPISKGDHQPGEATLQVGDKAHREKQMSSVRKKLIELGVIRS